MIANVLDSAIIELLRSQPRIVPQPQIVPIQIIELLSSFLFGGLIVLQLRTPVYAELVVHQQRKDRHINISSIVLTKAKRRVLREARLDVVKAQLGCCDLGVAQLLIALLRLEVELHRKVQVEYQEQPLAVQLGEGV